MLYHGQFTVHAASVTVGSIEACLGRCLTDAQCQAAAYSAGNGSCRIVTSQRSLSARTVNTNYEMYAKDTNCEGILIA